MWRDNPKQCSRHHLPRNHASKHHQQDGERDVDPLSHGGSMTWLLAEIEKTRGWRQPRQRGVRTGREAMLAQRRGSQHGSRRYLEQPDADPQVRWGVRRDGRPSR